jgi:hypothetical protein
MDMARRGPATTRHKERVFLCVGTDWEGHLSSIIHLFSVIAQQHPVIWINSIGQRGPRLSFPDIKRVAHKVIGMFRPSVPASATARQGVPRAVIEPRVIPYHQFKAVRRLNRWLLGRQLAPLLRRTVAPGADLFFVSANPAAVDLVGSFGAALGIYFCMDEYAEMPNADPRVIRMCEPLMLQAVDFAVATSQLLSKTKTNPRYETLYLPQGVDFEHFQYQGPCPAPLARLPRPIVGFQGIIGSRVDLRLVEKIARAYPRVSVVMLGRQEVDISPLKRYPNFHAFGAVPYEELPAWASQFDIGLIAYVQDGHTASVNPLKLLEYLAMGQQVVSVDLPELARYRDYVAIAHDHETYLAALAQLLARYPFTKEERERQRSAARGESWSARASQFLAACDEVHGLKRGLCAKPSGDGSVLPYRETPRCARS